MREDQGLMWHRSTSHVRQFRGNKIPPYNYVFLGTCVANTFFFLQNFILVSRREVSN